MGDPLGGKTRRTRGDLFQEILSRAEMTSSWDSNWMM